MGIKTRITIQIEEPETRKLLFPKFNLRKYTDINNAVKLGYIELCYNEQMFWFQMTNLLHKSTRLLRTPVITNELAGPELLVITEIEKYIISYDDQKNI